MQKKQFLEKIRLTNRRKNGLLYSINELLMRDWIMTSEKKKNRKVYVVGHKNPDTDSICCTCLCKFEEESNRPGICCKKSRPG